MYVTFSSDHYKEGKDIGKGVIVDQASVHNNVVQSGTDSEIVENRPLPLPTTWLS